MKIINLALAFILTTNSSYGFKKINNEKKVFAKCLAYTVGSTIGAIIIGDLIYNKDDAFPYLLLLQAFNYSIIYNTFYSNSDEATVNNAINILESISNQDIELLKLPEEELNNFINNLKNDVASLNGFIEKMKTIKFKLGRAYRIACGLQNHSSQNIKDTVKEIMEFCSNTRPLVKRVLRLSKTYSTQAVVI